MFKDRDAPGREREGGGKPSPYIHGDGGPCMVGAHPCGRPAGRAASELYQSMPGIAHMFTVSWAYSL